MTGILDHALAAAGVGLSVVPPRQDGTKAPDAQWKRYTTALPDAAQLHAWYADGGRTGLGLVCGAVSGHLELLELDHGAIDPDTGLPRTKAEQWAQFVDAAAAAGLSELLDQVAGGYVERTPSGGLHLIYRCTEPVDGNLKLARRHAHPLEYTDEERRLVDEKGHQPTRVVFETRGEGGYVVVAPSNGGVHPTGGRWELLRGGFGTIATITPAQRQALLDVARSFDQMPASSPVDVPTAPTGGHDGDGWMGDVIAAYNAATTWADLLGGHGWRHHHTAGHVDYWTRPGKEPRDGHSATTNALGTDRLIVFSSAVDGFRTADGNGPAPSYDRFGAYAVLEHAGDRVAAAKTANHAGHGPAFQPGGRDYTWDQLLPADQVPTEEPLANVDADWDTPTPITGARKPPPPFPLHTLPGWIRTQAEDVAHQLQVPVDLPAILGLGALATVVGGKIRLQVTAGWREHLNVYLAVAMPPSSGKSPAFKAMFAPVETLEAEQQQLHKRSSLEAAQRKTIAERKAKDLETKAAKSGSRHDEDAAVAAFIEAAEADIPKPPRYLTDDATPEALQVVLADCGGRITIASTEGGLFELMTGRYSDGRANLDVYLKAWSSDPIRIDRIGRPPVHVPEPVVTVALAIQPDVIQALAQRPELAGRGLTARFMYALPTDLVGTRDLTAPRPATTHIRAAYADQLLTLGKRCASYEFPGDLHLAPDAGARYGQWRQALEARRLPDGDLRHVAEWTGKLEATALRVAALLHIADGGALTGDVDDDTMARAIEIADYWLAHALEVHARWHLDTSVEDAQALLDWASRTGPGPHKRHDLEVGVNRFRRDLPRLRDALERLVDTGWCRTDDGAPVELDRGRGRPGQRFLFHPEARANPREPASEEGANTHPVRAGSRGDSVSGED